MSVAGIIDAMRANVHPTIRIVWQCLENHANGARWWRMTEREIATEVHLSPKTVERAVIALEGKGDDAVLPAVVAVRRCKRRPATFTMLRSYPEGCPKPRHEPEVASRVAPELTRQNGDSTAELTRQNDDSLFPPEKNPPEEERESPPQAAAPASSSTENLVEVGEASQQGADNKGVPAAPPAPPPAARSARRTPLPDDWAPPPEVRQMAIEAGYDPAEIMEEMADWARATGARSADWTATGRNWIRREGKFYGRRATGPSGTKLNQHIEETHAHYAAMAQRFGMLPDAGLPLGGQP
jgi:hypothetical protein